MAYLKAVLLAVLAGVVVGVGSGAWEVVKAAFQRLPPGDKATVLSYSISVAMNCTAAYIVLLVPLAMALVFVARRMRARSSRGGER